MGNPVIEALRAALELKKQEILTLESAIRKAEQEELSSSRNPKPKRFRKATGFKSDSIPYHINAILNATHAPLSASDLSEALKAKGKTVDSNMVAASINRYIGTIFRRNEEGKYLLVR
jgi:hypothetical protein